MRDSINEVGGFFSILLIDNIYLFSLVVFL